MRKSHEIHLLLYEIHPFLWNVIQRNWTKLRLTLTDGVEAMTDECLYMSGSLRLISIKTHIRILALFQWKNHKSVRMVSFHMIYSYRINTYIRQWLMDVCMCVRMRSIRKWIQSTTFFFFCSIFHWPWVTLTPTHANSIPFRFRCHSFLLLNLVIKKKMLFPFFIGCCCIFDVALSKPTRSKRPTGTCSFSI